MTLAADILHKAALDRSSINAAANALEEASGGTLTISVGVVSAAIKAWDAEHDDEPAGEYWNVCERAALALETK